jgi:hypothetical protein
MCRSASWKLTSESLGFEVLGYSCPVVGILSLAVGIVQSNGVQYDSVV